MANQEEDRPFSAADLEPSDEDRRAAIMAVVERAATSVAVLAAGTLVGGMVALGACAAPLVFELTPAPFSGNAMGAAFARFDQIAIGSAVTVLACEMVRTWIERTRPRSLWPRIRRLTAIALAMCAVYVGVSLTPRINELHLAGVRRNVGAQGMELEKIHKRAEMTGKAEVALGIAVVLLHVLTLKTRRPEDDEDWGPSPGAPGGD